MSFLSEPRLGASRRHAAWREASGRAAEILDELRRHDSALWRRAIDLTVTHGPEAWVRLSPPLVGLLVGALLRDHRAKVRDNLRLVLGVRSPAEEWADVARLFVCYANCLTEAFVAGSERGDRLVAHNLDDHNFVSALSDGRGVIIATAHTGGWQAAGPLLKRGHEADVLVVMQRERDERAQAVQDQARDRAGIRIVHVGDDPLDALPLLGHLKRGGVIAVQVDRLPAGMRSREGRLFDAPWRVPEGPLRLAALSGAPIVPTFTRRLRYMEYEVHTLRPIRLPRRPSPSELDAAAQQVLDGVADFVRKNPTQWFHFE